MDTKVYVVSEIIPCEGESIVGIFSDKYNAVSKMFSTALKEWPVSPEEREDYVTYDYFETIEYTIDTLTTDVKGNYVENTAGKTHKEVEELRDQWTR